MGNTSDLARRTRPCRADLLFMASYTSLEADLMMLQMFVIPPLHSTCPDKNWIEMVEMPTARGGLATSHFCSVIYIFGGEGSRILIPDGLYKEIGSCDIKSDT